MLRLALSWASPAGQRARLSILVLHRVVAQPDPLFPGEMDCSRFDAICGWLRAWFNVIPLTDAVQRLKLGSLPARALAISFDDGYADNQLVALPILQRHCLPATCFVTTGFLDGGCMWNDRVIEAVRRTTRLSVDVPEGATGAGFAMSLASVVQRRAAVSALLNRIKYLDAAERQRAVDRVVRDCDVVLPGDLMLSTHQLRAWSSAPGMSVGAHTVRHPILKSLGAEAARAEIRDGSRQLADLVQQPIQVFAYPNGKPGFDFTARDVALVKEQGFVGAVSTAWGAASAQSDPFQLPRFMPWDRTRMRFGLRLLTNLRRVGDRAEDAHDSLTSAATL